MFNKISSFFGKVFFALVIVVSMGIMYAICFEMIRAAMFHYAMDAAFWCYIGGMQPSFFSVAIGGSGVAMSMMFTYIWVAFAVEDYQMRQDWKASDADFDAANFVR